MIASLMSTLNNYLFNGFFFKLYQHTGNTLRPTHFVKNTP